jgi:hypothetical protein
MSDIYRPQARLIPPGGDFTDPLAAAYALYLWRRMEDGIELITAAGPIRVPEGSPERPTLRIPPEFMTPLANAILKDQGTALPSDAATLTQALEVERRRVDEQLEWLRSGQVSVLTLKDEATR